jgi:hypothetical protein
MRKKLMIAVLNQGNVHTELVSRINNWFFQNKYELMVSYPNKKPITNNRNNIVLEFLNSGADYLMMIDGDIVPPLTALNLVDFELDVVAPLLFMYQENMIIPIVLERKPDGLYTTKDIRGQEGLIEVDAVGSGCLVMSRKVLEKIRFPFKNTYDADGIKLYGLDIYFCQQAKKAGFKIYAHLDYPCKHFTNMDLKEIYVALEETERVKNNLEEKYQSLKKQIAENGSKGLSISK